MLIFGFESLQLCLPCLVLCGCYSTKVFISVQALCAAARYLSEGPAEDGIVSACEGELKLRGVFVDVHDWFSLCCYRALEAAH